MSRRRIMIGAVSICVIGALLSIAFSWDSQPTYQGIKLSDWLDSIKQARANQNPSQTVWPTEVEHALQNIGTNGLPYLIKWIGYEKAGWKKGAGATYQKWPRWLVAKSLADRLSYDRDERLGDNAVISFRILGRDAAPAAPQLIAILRDRQKPTASRRAIVCLGLIGPAARPALPYLKEMALTSPAPAAIDALIAIQNIDPRDVERSR